jgi:hypothetical protein
MNKLLGRAGEKSKHQTSTRFSRKWRMEHTCRTKGSQSDWTDSRQRPFSRDQFRNMSRSTQWREEAVGGKAEEYECLCCHKRETDCGLSWRDAVRFWVTPDVSDEPVRRGSPPYTASDPRISNYRRRNVFLMSYLFWVKRRRSIVVMIWRFGIFFDSTISFFF